MEQLKLCNLIKTHCPEKTAVISVSQSGLLEHVPFKTVFKLISQIKLFFAKHNVDENTCIGLLMEKNFLILPIIISFQDLHHPFVFLTTSTLVTTTCNLNIKWILSIDIRPSTDEFDLNDTLKLTTGDEIYLWINRNFKQDGKNYLAFQNIFCVVQTSGSTGENKIIRVPHSCIGSNVTSLNKHFNITTDDVIYWGTPLTFDPTLVELMLGILCQATLVIVPKLVTLNPMALYDALFKINSITFLQVVPSIFLRWSTQQITDILSKSSLKILAFGGEAFPIQVLNYKRTEDLRIFNLYGVTELSCWATIADVTSYPATENEVPLGTCLDETFVQVSNENEEVISVGVGQICIGSHTRYCLTNDANEPSPSQIIKTGDLGEWRKGNLYYCGRKTRIIKRFGHRLVFHKMENVILNETGLQSRFVYSDDCKKLLAFILIEHFDKNIKTKLLDKLKVKLLKILPEHGFPDFIDILTHFPLNEHGKISDKSLKNFHKNSYDENLEVRNAGDVFIDILSSYLKIELKRDIKELSKRTFFELGGNSILAMQCLRNLEEMTGRDNPGELVTLLINESIEKCLNYVIQNVIFKRKLCDIETRGFKVLETIPLQQDCVLWTYDFKGCVDASPFAFENSAKIYIAAGSFAQIFSIIHESGEEYLKLTFPQEIEAQASASTCGNFVFIGCSNGTMYSIDLVNKKIAWDYHTLQQIKSSACVCENRIIFGSYDGFLYCLAIERGTLCWKTDLLGIIRTDPVHDENLKVIYVGTLRNMCYALNEENGSVIWNYKVEAPVFGSPCIVKNCTVWSSVNGKLYCISPTGNINWTHTVAGEIFSSLIVKEDTIYFGCHDSSLYKITSSDTINYEVSAIVKLKSEISSSPRLYDYESKSYLISVCNIGILYVIDTSLNSVLFRMQLPAESFSSPYVYNNKVYVGCRDDKLYCVDIGEILKS